MGIEPNNHTLALSISPINDPLGNLLGHLLLFHDVTEQKRTQSQLMEQQRVLATMQERERLARELHDSAGQVLGYVSMQAQAIRKHVRDGNLDAADAQLGRLAEEASAAHVDIRESILSLKAGGGSSLSFLTALRKYINTYGEHYGVQAELAIPEDMNDAMISPDMSAQLMRVIGEALSNARKHSRADHVRIALNCDDGALRIVIADDGRGFEPSQAADGGTHYGLLFMRERMTQIGGGLEIDSCPGEGTSVSLRVPIRDYHGVGL
jgi:signal transduction histidine kinase